MHATNSFPETPKAPVSAPRRRRGATMVEFALIMPIAFALIFAVIDFSLYYYYEASMSYILRDSLRFAVTGSTTTDSSGTTLSKRASMIAYAKSKAPPLVTVTDTGANATLAIYVYDESSSSYVAATDTNWLPGCRIKGVLSQQIKFLTPFPKLMGITTPGTFNLQVVTIYKMERYDL